MVPGKMHPEFFYLEFFKDNLKPCNMISIRMRGDDEINTVGTVVLSNVFDKLLACPLETSVYYHHTLLTS
ncbi:MAG: hypothetical protein KatS3mg015_3134 [Fimbriimonadales bacterium]|nr:MAG: hypothetical protein KatS3mg015_3134 [Fimbriimonadales bacterium]